MSSEDFSVPRRLIHQSLLIDPALSLKPWTLIISHLFRVLSKLIDPLYDRCRCALPFTFPASCIRQYGRMGNFLPCSVFCIRESLKWFLSAVSCQPGTCLGAVRFLIPRWWKILYMSSRLSGIYLVACCGVTGVDTCMVLSRCVAMTLHLVQTGTGRCTGSDALCKV